MCPKGIEEWGAVCPETSTYDTGIGGTTRGAHADTELGASPEDRLGLPAVAPELLLIEGKPTR